MPERPPCRLQRALCVLAFAAACLPLASAVTCDSYRSRAECKGQVVDSGQCGWVAGTCRVVAPLPEGVAAITSVEDEPSFAITEEQPEVGAAMEPAVEAAASPARRGRRMILQDDPFAGQDSFSDQPLLPPPAEETFAGLPAAGVPAPPAPSCTDVSTPDPWTCAQQAGWGKCGEPWMVQGGFCRETCGLCPPIQPTQGGGQGAAGTAPSAATQGSGPASAAFCTQPPVTGPCRAAFPSWYFDPSTGTCRTFLYGGCQGNDNRFDSFEACTAAAVRLCGASA